MSSLWSWLAVLVAAARRDGLKPVKDRKYFYPHG